MKDQNKTTKNWISFRVKPEEYERIQKLCKATTSRKLSEYVRKVLLNKPVTMNHRNQSVDEILSELIEIRSELNAIGNNYNQAVRKLHTLENSTEIKTWLLLNEPIRQRFMNRVEQIKERMNQLYELWSQE